jgi:hypothetical protein
MFSQKSDAVGVLQLMRKIREARPEGKIVLVLDNARYQACYFGEVWSQHVEHRSMEFSDSS